MTTIMTTTIQTEDLTLVALAAGVGSRYGGLKQLRPVGPGHHTLLEYSIYDALKVGFARVVLVVRPELEADFRDRFAGGLTNHVRVEYVHQTLHDPLADFTAPTERTKPWGTGQAILAAEAVVTGPFAVVNADDFYGAESFAAMAHFLPSVRKDPLPTFAVVGFGLGQTLTEAGPVSRALCQLDDNGYLQKIVEIAEVWKSGDRGRYIDLDGTEVVADGNAPVSMNMWGFGPALFPELRRHFEEFLARKAALPDSEFLVPEVIQSLINEGKIRVAVLPQRGQWCGITFPEDEQRVAAVIAALVERGDYPRHLWQ